MDKRTIIREIQQTAKANGGKPLGLKKFEAATGIKYREWYGRFWSCWGDAVREAGLKPNRMNEGFDETFLVEQLALLTRRIGHVPTIGDLGVESTRNANFPCAESFSRRLGRKEQQKTRVLAFCGSNAGFEDVAKIWRNVSNSRPTMGDCDNSTKPIVGFVYLIKHGSRREYKIGRTFNPLRREGELGIQLPEACLPVHYIQTDDPKGVEAYWHRRFADKRKQGEWFSLSSDDVRAFKRWRCIY